MIEIFKSLRILILISSCSLILGCYPPEPTRSPNSRTDKYLSKLPDSWKLSTLAFIGSHSSAAYDENLNEHVKTQDMSISTQLESGIRVLDITVHLTNNTFVMHHYYFHLSITFDELLIEVQNFLENHPQELVIIFMQEEFDAKKNHKSNCYVLKKYITKFRDLFVDHWSIDDTLGQHRGKILLARGNVGFQGCTQSLPCKIQNDHRKSNWKLKEHKWQAIKSLQDEIFQRDRKFQCYINFLSISSGVSKTPREIARSMRGQSRRGSGVDLTFTDGMVELMTGYFVNSKNVLYIIFADFPYYRLCDTITEMN
ncbi:Similar to 1-phosphatidylinositol phosphodiesterase (Bacillus cereus) [Cotesia congregata]|uniref:Similar to 1-phosphatidylinositol phosphodiesterase (Bacillus cereus) n=1 Tax=Cotesia congregata TaxID=51543 RepID=A0A8J2H390_COTCN|nr:Similar to 1-phosphatidylinositol phosphodiesterase (Bacillus cereus) [Cotesia congregata]